MKKLLWAGAALTAAVAMMAPAVKAKDHTDKFHEAAQVLQEIHQAPDKDIPESLWEKAECIAVFPTLKKAAFIIGGEFGKGVMACRNGGAWSAPAIMEMQKGSVGFQIGGETVDLVFLVMNEHGVNRLLQDKVALGAEGSVAAGPVGRDARAMTDAQLKAEILSYSRSQGAFAGVNLTGGTIRPDHSDNNDLYGRTVTVREILLGKRLTAPPSASEFYRALKLHVRGQA